MEVTEFNQIQLISPPTELTDAELKVIQEVFSSGTVKKYLNYLLWDLIKDHANIPIPTLSSDLMEAAIKQAFVKGNLNIIQTLLSIQKPKPPQ